MHNRPQIIRDLIARQRAAGQSPVEIHMNAQTRREFAAEAGIKPEPSPDYRSLLSRLTSPRNAPAVILRFDGVLLVDNEAIADSGMLLRPIQLMDDPDWLKTIKWAEQQGRLTADRLRDVLDEEDGTPPWPQRAADVSVPHPDAGITASDLAQGGGVNPTTCLFKAYEGLDKVADVVILRFYKNGDIDMTSTFNKYAVVGSLQAALNHIVNGER